LLLPDELRLAVLTRQPQPALLVTFKPEVGDARVRSSHRQAPPNCLQGIGGTFRNTFLEYRSD
jgi:hypothetical protein